MSQELDRFGEFLIKNLRDQAINYYDKLSKGEWKAPSLKPLQSDFAYFGQTGHRFRF